MNNTKKLKEKDIIRLDANEVADLLDEVENGEKLTRQQQVFHDKTELRDEAMMTLMLGTGIRVSECVGLNMNDVDFNNDGILDLVVGLNTSPDLGVGSRQCIVTAYPLDVSQMNPNAPADLSDFEVTPNY